MSQSWCFALILVDLNANCRSYSLQLHSSSSQKVLKADSMQMQGEGGIEVVEIIASPV